MRRKDVSFAVKIKKFIKQFYVVITATLARILMAIGIFLITLRSVSVNTAIDDRALYLSYIPPGSNVSIEVDESEISDLPSYVYWLPTIGIALLIPEFAIIVYIRGGHEYKWWSPSMTIYVISCLFSFWMMESHLYTMKSYGIKLEPNASTFDEMKIFDEHQFCLIDTFSFISFGGTTFKEYDWSRLMKQCFFLVLLFAKWLTPKGIMTRDQLSLLLFAYVVMATDILDFVESLMYIGLGNVFSYFLALLIIYSMSNLQFMLNYTATLNKKHRFYKSHLEESGKTRKLIHCCCFSFASDMWVMITTVLLQDGPFFVVRLFIIFEKRIITFANIFFLVKNGIILCMDIYRLLAIIGTEISTWKAFKNKVEPLEDEKPPPSPVESNFADRDDRAEIRVSIDRENNFEAVAEYVKLQSDENYDHDEGRETITRRRWSNLNSKISEKVGSGALSVVYQVDVVLDSSSFQYNMQLSPNIIIKAVSVNNVVNNYDSLNNDATSGWRRVRSRSSHVRHQIFPLTANNNI